MGNPELRALLVVGATAVLRVARNDARTRPWLKALLARRPFKVAAVAQANKTARIIWALLNQGGTYRRAAPLAITAVAV
ncbi:transposase (plasmid) [Ensifer sp. WSM1721]